jgi:hypothetical protein
VEKVGAGDTPKEASWRDTAIAVLFVTGVGTLR